MMVQRAPLVTMLAIALFGPCAPRSAHRPEELVGRWEGRAAWHHAATSFALDVTREGDSLVATMSAPELLLVRQKIGRLSFAPPRVHFRLPDEDAPIAFDGWNRRDSIVGSFSSRKFGDERDPLRLPRLSLCRVAGHALPYREDTVRFPGAGVSLAGSILVPTRPGPHPALVFLHGATTPERDHYRGVAERFVRDGFVTLIYDKRGSGGSSGDAAAMTLEDLVADAGHALAWLSARPGIDASRVGLWGLSQGALLAPRVAERHDVAFVIAISPPGITLGRTFAWQDSVRVARGRPSARTSDHWPHYFELAKDEDPLVSWRRLRAPVLVVFGERDELVPAALSAALVRAALKSGGDKDATVRMFPRANHEIRLSPEGAEPFDWPKAAPGYVDSMLAWARARAGRSRLDGPASAR